MGNRKLGVYRKIKIDLNIPDSQYVKLFDRALGEYVESYGIPPFIHLSETAKDKLNNGESDHRGSPSFDCCEDEEDGMDSTWRGIYLDYGWKDLDDPEITIGCDHQYGNSDNKTNSSIIDGICTYCQEKPENGIERAIYGTTRSK